MAYAYYVCFCQFNALCQLPGFDQAEAKVHLGHVDFADAGKGYNQLPTK